MALQTISLNRLLTLAFAVWACSSSSASANAVGGSVRDAASQQVLGGVDVEVVQDSTKCAKTQKSDGVYTLDVPSSFDPFDLVFKKAGYLNAFDPDVKNRGAQTRPPVDMVERSANSIRNLGSKHLEPILQNYLKAAERAKDLKSAILTAAIKDNLREIEKADITDDKLHGIIQRIKRALGEGL
jgi:hypothetical protein